MDAAHVAFALALYAAIISTATVVWMIEITARMSRWDSHDEARGARGEGA